MGGPCCGIRGVCYGGGWVGERRKFIFSVYFCREIGYKYGQQIMWKEEYVGF